MPNDFWWLLFLVETFWHKEIHIQQQYGGNFTFSRHAIFLSNTILPIWFIFCYQRQREWPCLYISFCLLQTKRIWIAKFRTLSGKEPTRWSQTSLINCFNQIWKPLHFVKSERTKYWGTHSTSSSASAMEECFTLRQTKHAHRKLSSPYFIILSLFIPCRFIYLWCQK